MLQLSHTEVLEVLEHSFLVFMDGICTLGSAACNFTYRNAMAHYTPCLEPVTSCMQAHIYGLHAIQESSRTIRVIPMTKNQHAINTDHLTGEDGCKPELGSNPMG